MVVGTVQVEGFPAFDIAILPRAANGDVYNSKLSSVESVQLTMQDAVYTAGTAVLSYTKSGQAITLVMSGYSSGTVNLVAYGRL